MVQGGSIAGLVKLLQLQQTHCSTSAVHLQCCSMENKHILIVYKYNINDKVKFKFLSEIVLYQNMKYYSAFTRKALIRFYQTRHQSRT